MSAPAVPPSAATSTNTEPHPTDAPTVRPARRHQRPGWRDPRILLGLVIVAGSILLGVKVLSAADDTVAVWAAASDLPAGTRLQAADAREVRIRFTSADQADRYLSADSRLPGDRVLDRAVASGELLPRSALASRTDALVEIPVAVAVDDVPSTVRAGSKVDVWVTPQTAETADKLADATRVLEDVVVVRASSTQDSLSPTASRQIVVGVDPDEAGTDQMGSAIGRLAAGRVVIARHQ